jgi:hypothetical protein
LSDLLNRPPNTVRGYGAFQAVRAGERMQR